MLLEHGFGPVYDERSRVLILGSFPSVRSRAQGFYYGHPQNRFWPLMALLFGGDAGNTPEARRAYCLERGIALWDVVERCEIEGSADSSIKNVQPTDLMRLLGACDIQRICINGATAYKLYEKYQRPLTGREALRLPSTSPANAVWSLERLYEAWRAALAGA